MRREVTNQHGIICPTENEAIKEVMKDERKRVRNILRNWGRADRENERLKAEYDVIIEEIDALYGEIEDFYKSLNALAKEKNDEQDNFDWKPDE